MAVPSPPAVTAARPRQAVSILRSLVPYFIVALAAALIWGTYFFVYVPPKLQYFLGSRFRTLAVSAGQLRSKIESLAVSVQYAEAALGKNPKNKSVYLQFVVPELRDGHDGDGLYVGSQRIAWDDVIAQAADASRADFDDLVLADASGKVVWQREVTTPRIGSLPELLEARGAADGGSMFGIQWTTQTTQIKGTGDKTTMPQTATSNVVNLDGTTVVLITQPIRIANVAPGTLSAQQLFLGGLVARDAINSQATHVPSEWIVLALLPFAIVFLALPFIKLATVTQKERYGLTDVIALSLFTVVLAAIGAALPFMSDSPSRESDPRLEKFADEIQQHLGDETKTLLKLTTSLRDPAIRTQIAQHLEMCQVAIPNPANGNKEQQDICNFWNAWLPIAADTDVRPGFADLDVIWWMDQNARQTEKWSAKAQATAFIQQRFQHYQDVVARRLWTLKDDTKPFTIEPLRSPTTSELAFVFAVPTDNEKEPMLAINVKPQSLVDALLPPGYGFAVLSPDGRVLFHSQPALSLEENFLREVSNESVVGHAIASGERTWWTGEYHGRRHEFFSEQWTTFEKCPWRVVTFRETEPLLAFTASRQTGALALALIDFVVLFVAAAICLLLQRNQGRSLLDLVSALSLRAQQRAAIEQSTRRLLVLLVIGALAIASTYIVPPEYLSFVFLFFAISPIVIVITVVSGRLKTRGYDEMEYDPHAYWRAALEIFLIALLVGALPIAGMTRVVHRLDEFERTLDWMIQAQQRMHDRESRVGGSVRATKNYSIPDETKNLLFDKGGFAAPTPSDTALPYSYFDVAGISITTPRVPPPQRYSSWGVHSILRGVRGLFSSSKVVPPTVGLSWTEGKLRLPEDSNGRQIAAVYPIGSPLALVSWPAFFGIVVLGATFLVVAWARRTLAGADAAERRSVGDTIKEIEGMARTSIAAKQPPRANQAVLVIGAPRAAKDGVARRAVVDASGHPPEHRIDLLNLKLTPWWTAAELEKIDALKMKDEQRLLWIHVANLETQLVDAESRAELFRLLEGLFRFKADEHTRVASLVVTSTIDPIAHFTDVFVEERQQIYANAVPEVELNRSSLLLSRFRRCYVPLVGRNPWPKWFCYHPRKWRIVLRRETSSHLLLDSIGRDIAAAWKDVKAVSSEDLRSAVLSRAEACYQLLWTSCTRSEKLVLIQLAQEGLVNPKNRETLDELVAKGLVLTGPVPTLFNITFRDFLQGIERSSVVQEWERTEGTGLWMMAGRLAASVLVVGGVFYLITQGFAVQSVLPIISGSGLLGIPLVKDLVSRVSTPKDGAARLS